MLFFFRKTPIVWDVFTYKHHAYHHAKVQRGDKFFPEWWKKLPNRYMVKEGLVEAPTAKKCPGIIDMYRDSVVIPMWSDLNIELSVLPGAMRYQYSDQESDLSYHDIEQYDDAFDQRKAQHVKLRAPWLGTTKTPFKMFWSNPLYNRGENLFTATTLPGVIEYNEASMQFNINMLLKRNEVGETIHKFKFGEPMVVMMPMTDKEIIIKHHLLSLEEYKQKEKTYTNFRFGGTYRTLRNLQNSKSSDKKCPFKL